MELSPWACSWFWQNYAAKCYVITAYYAIHRMLNCGTLCEPKCNWLAELRLVWLDVV